MGFWVPHQGIVESDYIQVTTALQQQKETTTEFDCIMEDCRNLLMLIIYFHFNILELSRNCMLYVGY